MNKWRHCGPPLALQEFYESHSRTLLTSRGLRQQSRLYHGTGGSSSGNRGAGFVPGFVDRETGATYTSSYADGSRAPVHLLDGLPEVVIVRRSRKGKVTAVKGSVLAGFLRDGRFYTREEAARCLADETAAEEETAELEPQTKRLLS